MKKLLSILMISSSLIIAADVAMAKGRLPCSGKKGGVAYCTKGGKFVCNDGSISKSKQKCSVSSQQKDNIADLLRKAK